MYEILVKFEKNLKERKYTLKDLKQINEILKDLKTQEVKIRKLKK